MVDYKENGMIRFEVRNVTEADLGKYRCSASNILGYDNSIAQLNLESKRTNAVLSFCLNTLCFATKSIFNSTNMLVTRLPTSSKLVQSVTSGRSVELSITYLSTWVMLAAFCLYVCIGSLLSDHSTIFPCDDSLKSITEYVFKCDHND